MIRRGVWLLAGAVLGVTGYRKASRMAAAITGTRVPARPLAGAPRPIAARTPVPFTARIRSAAGFARDVREGMADYRDSRGRQLGHRLESHGVESADRAPSSRSSARGSFEP